jgi:hypothetical protein
MKLKDQVVSLELAQEMKELGAEQDSIWYWTWVDWNDETEWVIISQDSAARTNRETFSAYTTAELGEMLPGRMKTSDSGWNYLHTTKLENTNEWSIAYFNDELKGSSEADARAKMLLYLIKEGLVKAEEVGK